MMRTLQDALCTADAVRQLKERGMKIDADMQDQLSLADEIYKLADAARAVLEWRVDTPLRGDLRDNDKSREALRALADAIASFEKAITP